MIETPNKRVRWRHQKGGMYVITGFGIDEATMEPEVYYQAVSMETDKPEGPTWSRRCAVFFDGRFTQINETINGEPSFLGGPDDSGT